MRKVDYILLASIIKEEIASANTWLKFEPKNSTDEKIHNTANGRKSSAVRIGCNFANGASVNKTEFLKACGIE